MYRPSTQGEKSKKSLFYLKLKTTNRSNHKVKHFLLCSQITKRRLKHLRQCQMAEVLFEANWLQAGSPLDWTTSGQWKQRLSDGAQNGVLSGQLQGHGRGQGCAYITCAVEDRGIQAWDHATAWRGETETDSVLCGWGMGGGSWGGTAENIPGNSEA